MNTVNFDRVAKKQMETCMQLLTLKGDEYSPKAMKNTEADRLAAFKRAAAITDSSPKKALLGMLAKHLVSLSDMCCSATEYTMERWSEKITDSINYLIILRAIVEEEHNNESNSSEPIEPHEPYRSGVNDGIYREADAARA